MRLRSVLMNVLVVLFLVAIPPAQSASDGLDGAVVLAQERGTDSEQGEGGDPAGEGQKDPEAETDPGAGEEAGGEEEEGPPWTYQMARMTIVMVLLLGGALALLYRRMIGTRQKGRA